MSTKSLYRAAAVVFLSAFAATVAVFASPAFAVQTVNFTNGIINSSGYLGIGTTTPISPFQVGNFTGSGYDTPGEAAFVSGSDNNNVLEVSRNGSNPQDLELGANQTNLYGDIQAAHAGVAYDVLSLNPLGGNVGVGTTTSGYTFTVSGTGNFTGTVNVGTPTAASNAATKSYVDSAVASGVNGGISGTANYFPVFTGTNTVGNSVMYQSGSTVGIGTTNPNGYTFLVNGRAQAQSLNIAAGDGPTDLVNNAPWYGIGNSNLVLSPQTTYDAVQVAGFFGLNFQTQSGQMVMNSSGEVGVGTTTPNATFNVDGNFEISNPTYDNVLYGWANDANDFSIEAHNGANSVKKNIILDAWGGNVGIGTASPSYTLDVAGTIRTTSGGIIFPDGSTQTTAFLGGSSQTITAGNVSAGTFGSNTGGGNYTFPAGLTSNSWFYAASYVQTPQAYPLSYSNSFNINSGNAAQNAWINALTVAPGGDVGIGTTAPATLLDVSGAGATIDVHGSYNANLTLIPSGSGALQYVLSATGAGASQGAGEFIINDGTYDVLNIRTHDVGILTDNPGYALDVNGNARINNTLLSTAGDIYLQPASYNVTEYNGSSAYLFNIYNGGTRAVSLNSNGNSYLNGGNVGIGTTTPSTTLSVVGSGGLYIHDTTSGASPSGLVIDRYNWPSLSLSFTGSNSVWRIENGNTAVGDLQFTYNGTPDVTVNSSGYVGIGTTSPSYALDVKNPSSAVAMRLTGPYNDNTQLRFAGASNGELWAIGTNVSDNGTNGDFQFYNLGNDGGTAGADLTILGSGNVGIGTTSPGYKLEVDGTGEFTGKLTANTIDPLYTIGGTNYSTYVPGMTGEKEETAGTVDLQQAAGGGYTATLDFAGAAKGSDLWLFAQATNLANTMSQMIVALTPSFDGNVWYTKNMVADTLTIHGTAAGEVSYTLTAPRFDAAQWPNLAPADESGTKGLIINP